VSSTTYNESLPGNGGTDAIEIYHGMILISAFAPGTTGAAAPQANYPAVYRVVFNSATDVATVHALFNDEDSATVANRDSSQFGQSVPLALTDPDSNEDVPYHALRFAGDVMLTSQADMQQIFVHDAGTPRQRPGVRAAGNAVPAPVAPLSAAGVPLRSRRPGVTTPGRSWRAGG
jgi:hypothetical protein